MLTTDSVSYSAGCIGRGGIPNPVLGRIQSVRDRSPPEGGDNQPGLDFLLISAHGMDRLIC